MDTTSLEAAVASLPEQDRIVVGALVDQIGTIVTQLDKMSEALVLFDRLDDQREAELRALRARVRILTMHASGEISSQVLAETIAAVPPIMPESIRVEKADAGGEHEPPTQEQVSRFVTSQTAYWDELAKLRAERARIEAADEAAGAPAPTYRVVGRTGPLGQGLPYHAAAALAEACGCTVEEEASPVA